MKIKTKFIIVFVCLFLLRPVFADSLPQRDSLLTELKTADIQQIPEIYLNLSYWYIDRSLDTSRIYAFKALSGAGKANSKDIEADALSMLIKIGTRSNNLDSIDFYANAGIDLCTRKGLKHKLSNFLYKKALVFEKRSQFDSSMRYYKLSYVTALENSDTAAMTTPLLDIGYTFFIWGEMDSAVSYFNKTLYLAEKFNKKITVGRVLIALGNLYYSWNKLEKAIEYYKRAYKIAKELDSKSGMGVSLSNIGAAYSDLNNIRKSIEYLDKAIPILTENNDSDVLSNTFLTLAMNFVKEDKFDKAAYYMEKAINILEKTNNKEGITVAYLAYGNLYDKAGDFQKSIDYTRKALTIAKNMNFAHMIQRSYKQLTDLYKNYGFAKKALTYRLMYDSVKDSITAEKNQKQMADFEAKYKSEKQKKEIAILQKNNKIKELELNKKRWQQNTLFAGLIIMIMFIIILANKYKQNRKITKLLSEKNEFISKQNKDLEELTARQRELIATKDRFFSIIAHDLRSPFGSLKGLVEILNNEYDKLTEKQKRELIAGLNESTNKVYSLLENLLEWSYSQSKKSVVKKEKFHITDLANETITLLGPVANQKNIKILNFTDRETLVFADKNMVYTILRNLISNAIKFSHPGSEVKVVSEVKDDFVEITVKDQGVGIDKKELKALFDMGTKIQTQGTANETGTGLGLILCNEFVKKNGGTINVKSEKGKGSEFIFTLPRG